MNKRSVHCSIQIPVVVSDLTPGNKRSVFKRSLAHALDQVGHWINTLTVLAPPRHPTFTHLLLLFRGRFAIIAGEIFVVVPVFGIRSPELCRLPSACILVYALRPESGV